MKFKGEKKFVKRFIIVASLTGFAQIISLVSVGFLKKLDQSLVYDIGNYESLIVVFTAIISLGLQIVTVRDIAISDKWKDILLNSQKDRLTFSLLILVSVLFVDLIFKTIEIENMLFYVVIPLIALNSDYSFYGKGEPEKGAFLSFVRVGFLSVFIILSVIFDNPFIKITYIITVLVTYFLVGIVSSYFNEQPYFVGIKGDFYKSYLSSINVGIASFALVFFGLGIISFASFFYTEAAIANVYLLLKIYVFYIGIKRLVVQILFKELVNEKLALTVDRVGIIVGIAIVILLTSYPEMIIIYFTKDYENSVKNLIFLLPAIAFSSISITSSVSLLLKGKDRTYSIGFILGSVVILLLTCILSLLDNTKENYIYISISIGELVVIAIHGYGVGKLLFFKSRLVFFFGSAIVLIVINQALLMMDNKVLSLIAFSLVTGFLILHFLKSESK